MVEINEYGTENQEILILVHGGFTDASCYRNLVPVLSKNFHCIVPNFPSSEGRYTIEECTKQLTEVCEKYCKDGPVNFFGHCFGAALLQNFAFNHPEKIKSAVFGSINIKKTLTYAFAKTMLGSYLSYKGNPTFLDKIGMKPKDIKITNTSLYKNCIYKRNINKYIEKISNFNFPVLYLLAENDFKFTKESYEIIKRKKNFKGLIISDADHNYHWHKPEITTEVITNFINSNK